MKTSELIGPALDWAVAKALGLDVALITHANGTQPIIPAGNSFNYAGYSSLWDQGGPIIDQEGMLFHGKPGYYRAFLPHTLFTMDGPTHLIAAMRCFVASKLGDEVEIPKELQ